MPFTTFSRLEESFVHVCVPLSNTLNASELAPPSDTGPAEEATVMPPVPSVMVLPVPTDFSDVDPELLNDRPAMLGKVENVTETADDPTVELLK
jgi:hypothetical protein